MTSFACLCCRTIGTLQSKELEARAKWRKFWVQELLRCLPSIPIVKTWNCKQLERIFTGAASTLSRYVAGWNRFRDFCEALELSPDLCGPKEFVTFCEHFEPDEEDDALGVSDEGLPALRGSLAALRWLAPKVQLPDWDEALACPVVEGYRKDARDKRIVNEAPPLTLRALAALELVVCNAETSLGAKLVAGFFLLSTWSSLRWADCQRIPVEWIHLDGHILRGYCRQTKTSERGEAFAALTSGVTKASETGGWGLHYMKALQEWKASVLTNGGSSPDFLLPAVSSDFAHVRSSPSDRFAAMRRLQCMLQMFNLRAPELITSHSCKTTILAWANQLLIPEFDRLKQGKAESFQPLFGIHLMFLAVCLRTSQNLGISEQVWT